jgi:Na+/melibiose symporter-like transporter
LPAFHKMAAIMAVVPLVAGAVAFFGTAKAAQSDMTKSVKLSIGPWFTTLIQNKPLRVLLVTKLLHLLGLANAVTAMIYLATYVLDVGQKGMVLYGVASSIGGLCGVLTVTRLAVGRKKHHLYIGALLLLAADISSLAFLPHHSVTLFAIPAFGFGFLGMSALILAKSMVADIVEYDYLCFGVRRAGAVTSLITAIEKTMPVLSALFIGFMLSWGGYVAGKGAAMQPASAIQAIYLTVTIIPSVLLVLATLPLLFFYRLDEASLLSTQPVDGVAR